jgi:ubiquinone/menaquinone biosynthesis C-methylase UbiE
MPTPVPSTDGALSPESVAAATATLWGQTAVARTTAPIRGWLDSPLVLRECVHRRLNGNPDDDWLMGLVKRLAIPSTGRWLSLGCGTAGTEILAGRLGMYASMLALDAAQPALEVARQAAAGQGIDRIEFGTVDLNALTLPKAAFDVVMMCMSLHHVAALERVLRTVRQALKPDGWFLINEFVGPAQFQFPDRQLAVVRDLLASLPERLRMDCTTGSLKTAYPRRPLEHWNRWDPSEAVRSDEIVPLLHRHFDVALQLDYGGTVLNLLLEHIVHNFDCGRPADVEIFLLLARTEELLIREGHLGNDFTVMAMRKPNWRRRLWQPGSD